MDEIKYIDDPRGGRVPLTDAYGNLTIDAIVLYNKDLLSLEGKTLMDEILANDEMARDALEGYVLMANARDAKVAVASINKSLGTEKEAVITPVIKLDYKKLSAAAAVILLIGLGGFVGVKLIGQNQLAENTIEKKRDQDKPNQPSYESETAELEEGKKDVEQEISSDLFDGINQQNRLTDARDSAQVVQSKEPSQKPQKSKSAEKSSFDLAKAKVEDSDKREELLSKLAKLKGQQNKGNQGSGITKEAKSLETAAGNDVSLEDDLASLSIPEPPVIMNEKSYSEDVKEEEHAEVSRIAVETNSDENKVHSAKRTKQEPISAIANRDYAQNSSEPLAKNHIVYGANEVDQVPHFPGGDLALFKFIEKRKIHPPNLKSQGVEGEVFVSFQLDANGNVINVKPLRSDNSQMEADAIRVVRSMPKWQAAKKEGNSVKVKKTILIKYMIKQ
jgi:TonB family protein